MGKTTIRICLFLLGYFFVQPSGEPQSQRVGLTVTTQKCIQGILMHPSHVNVSVFDISKVPDLMRLAKELEIISNPTDQEGPEKMLSIFNTLQKRFEATHALARLKRLPASEYLFEIPLVSRVVVFGFGESEDDLTSFAKAEINPRPGQSNHVILSFSTEQECKGAK